MKNAHLLVAGAVLALLAALTAGPLSADTLCTRCIDTGSDDGADLFIGSPGETRGPDDEAGLAHLLVDGTAATTLGEGKAIGDGNTINGTPEDDDMFASSVAAGDFNGDGFEDIAIGVPYEDVGSRVDAGAVIVLLSDAVTGQLETSMVLTQNSPGFPGKSEAGDRFGYSLASGRFGNDTTYDELIIGVPYEDIRSISNAGTVHVVEGGPNGPDSTAVTSWNQDIAGVRGTPEAGDRFGYSVLYSPVGDEAWGTLIVGVPFEDVGSISNAGIVQVFYAESSGLTVDGQQLFGQNTDGMLGIAEAGDRFGYSLATGDFGSGYFDLAVGVPYEDRGSDVDAGIVQVINGSFNGLEVAGNRVIKQGTGQVDGSSEDDDLFGYALAAIPWEGDYILAIGAPGETLGGDPSAGSVHLVFDMAEDAEGLQTIHQGKPGIKGRNEPGDEFGYALTFSDLDNDGIPDLIIGGPGEDNDAGKVWVLYGSTDGFSADDAVLRQGAGGFGGTKEAGDRFGAVVLGGSR